MGRWRIVVNCSSKILNTVNLYYLIAGVVAFIFVFKNLCAGRTVRDL